MNDEKDVVAKSRETGCDAVSGGEFFEPHDDAYAANLYVLMANRNDRAELTERVS
jgi:hypothetical protein